MAGARVVAVGVAVVSVTRLGKQALLVGCWPVAAAGGRRLGGGREVSERREAEGRLYGRTDEDWTGRATPTRARVRKQGSGAGGGGVAHARPTGRAIPPAGRAEPPNLGSRRERNRNGVVRFFIPGVVGFGLTS